MSRDTCLHADLVVVWPAVKGCPCACHNLQQADSIARTFLAILTVNNIQNRDPIMKGVSIRVWASCRDSGNSFHAFWKNIVTFSYWYLFMLQPCLNWKVVPKYSESVSYWGERGKFLLENQSIVIHLSHKIETWKGMLNNLAGTIASLLLSIQPHYSKELIIYYSTFFSGYRLINEKKKI